MNDEELHKIHRQLLSLERAVRHSRLTVGALLTASEPSSRELGLRPVPSGLATLLESRKHLSDKRVAPYETFSEGVRLSFAGGGRNQIAVTQFCFDATPGVSEFASTLGVDVNLDKREPCSWVNLESDLDMQRVREAGSLKVSLAVSFRTGSSVDLGRYGLAIRAYAGNDHHDYFVRRFPAFEVPIEVTYEIRSEEFAPIPWQDFERAALIVDLPANRPLSYRLYMSHFEVEAHDK